MTTPELGLGWFPTEPPSQLAASGIHQVAIIPHILNPGDRLGLVRTFAQEVWSALLC
jgi:hypothetical protein